MLKRRDGIYGHSAIYHPYLLSWLPERFEQALDVGCGTGTFAHRLAARATTVHAVDRSREMIAYAAATTPPPDNINWIVGDVLTADLPSGAYDVVTAIASLHHMPLDRGLARLRELTRPGGVLAVLGLYRPATASDHGLDVIAALADPVAQAFGRRTPPAIRAPYQPFSTTLADITAGAARHLPGARIRRHVFYRYSLTWQRP